MPAHVGSAAPYFEARALLPDGSVRKMNLTEFRGKWLVLFFYTQDFSSVCPTEIVGFHRALPQFAAEDAAVVGCSCDAIDVHKAWIRYELKEIGYPLLADTTGNAAADYGVLLEAAGVPARGTFIIDPEGVMRAYAVTEPIHARSVNETLRMLQAARAGKPTGCDWRPGEPTL